MVFFKKENFLFLQSSFSSNDPFNKIPKTDLKSDSSIKLEEFESYPLNNDFAKRSPDLPNKFNDSVN